MNISQIEEGVKALVESFDADTFIYGLLEVYGKPKASISRLKQGGKGGYNLSQNEGEILWKKQLLFRVVKSKQLHSIIDDLKNTVESQKHEPRFIIVINQTDLLAIDTKNNDSLDTPIKKLHKSFDFFLPWAGLEKAQVQGDNPADVRAAEKMAKLFDLLRENNPAKTKEAIHAQNVFLSRILFCYFAEDTGIFSDKLFSKNIASHTSEDGSGLDAYLQKTFEVMNQESRKGLPNYLAEFPYVNGGLFADKLTVPKFTRKSRAMLIECGADLNWSEINPDIFGSMIQAVVHPDQRGNMGMHYTSVPNIMKVIEPLFLNELRDDFERNKGNKSKLEQLLLRLEQIKIFDPACGSGNFLIIAYKEIRKLEMEIFLKLKELSSNQSFPLSRISLSQFYGIELDDFAHEIAILSLWLAEHQMNVKFKQSFGHCSPSLPLKVGGHIHFGNALRIDWVEAFRPKNTDEIYLIGNPPYVSYSERNAEQKEDMDIVFSNVGKVMRLDYICCWLKKSSDLMVNRSKIKCAFLSTSSICQGEQASLLWPYIASLKLEIFFAYQSFKWGNNAKSNAGVSCIIVGIQNRDNLPKTIYKDGISRRVKSINPYLVEGEQIIVEQRSKSIANLPEMALGSSGIDGGNLILSQSEYADFISSDPKSKKFIKPYIGGEDFLDGNKRYCLWIEDDEVEGALSIDKIRDRVNKCKTFREGAGRDAKKAASVPHRFFYRKFKEGCGAIVLPMTSSERRIYIPIGIIEKGVVPSNGVLVVYDINPLLFGILSSKMHMVWVHAVSGRLESRIRYSVNLSYNNFPFPKIDKNRELQIIEASMRVISVRESYSELSLSQLYDPLLMPSDLLEAHISLDKAVEQCYRHALFNTNEDRLEHLFKLFEMITGASNA